MCHVLYSRQDLQQKSDVLFVDGFACLLSLSRGSWPLAAAVLLEKAMLNDDLHHEHGSTGHTDISASF